MPQDTREVAEISRQGAAVALDAWLDTGFTGELVLPSATVSELGLLHSAAIRAGLGDGSQVTLETYGCWMK
jgi:predicted aspartyl protease